MEELPQPRRGERTLVVLSVRHLFAAAVRQQSLHVRTSVAAGGLPSRGGLVESLPRRPVVVRVVGCLLCANYAYPAFDRSRGPPSFSVRDSTPNTQHVGLSFFMRMEPTLLDVAPLLCICRFSQVGSRLCVDVPPRRPKRVSSLPFSPSLSASLSICFFCCLAGFRLTPTRAGAMCRGGVQESRITTR